MRGRQQAGSLRQRAVSESVPCASRCDHKHVRSHASGPAATGIRLL